jgi:biotin transport system substrate-specific component
MTSLVLSKKVFPQTWVTSVLLVLGAATLTAFAAQWRIQLPFTPVPITGQTLAVLFTGAALGWRLGSLGQIVYVAAGILGAPVFSNGESGWEVVRGATGGYLIGFIFAAGLVGWMAEHRQDRSFSSMFTSFLLGSAVIYGFGVTGLMVATGWPLAESVDKGVVPFLLGDVLKAVLAGLLLPGAWQLLGER